MDEVQRKKTVSVYYTPPSKHYSAAVILLV